MPNLSIDYSNNTVKQTNDNLRIQTIIIVSAKIKRMKIVIRVFAKKNVNDSWDYKVIKEPA